MWLSGHFGHVQSAVDEYSLTEDTDDGQSQSVLSLSQLVLVKPDGVTNCIDRVTRYIKSKENRIKLFLAMRRHDARNPKRENRERST